MEAAPADLHVPVLGQLPLPEFALGDALEAGPLGGSRLRRTAREWADPAFLDAGTLVVDPYGRGDRGSESGLVQQLGDWLIG